jgi:hypothetical protein
MGKIGKSGPESGAESGPFQLYRELLIQVNPDGRSEIAQV